MNNIIKTKMNTIYRLWKPDFYTLLIFVFPFITFYVNYKYNEEIMNETLNMTFIYKLIFHQIIQNCSNYVLFGIARYKSLSMRLQLELAYNSCNIDIPGANKEEYELFMNEYNNVQDYITMFPIIWKTLVLVILNIMYINNIYICMHIIILIVVCVYILLNTMDDAIYRKIKSKPSEILGLTNPQYNYCKLSLGAIPNFNFHYNRKIKMMFQHHYQSTIISVLNCVCAILLVFGGDKSSLLNFMSVSWIIGTFCDTIKSYKYHYTIDTYYNMLDRFSMYMRNYNLQTTNSSIINERNNVLQFNNVSYCYVEDLFSKSILKSKDIIKDLSFTFRPNIYYLESPNGIGKSTFLKSMIYNIKSGSVLYNNMNLHDMSFMELYNTIYYVRQSSDFMPKFDKELITHFISNNIDIAKDFDVYQFLNKSSNEMSGGEKQRLNIFLALVSKCNIILFDEIFSEISSISSALYPNGIRNTIIIQLNKWNKILNKIIIIVGHGITINDSIKLKLYNSESDKTLLLYD